MQSTQEYRKNRFAKVLLPAHNSDLKRYDSLYQLFCDNGYTKELCDLYADAFVNDQKKPSACDIVQLCHLYDRIHDLKSVTFYLETLKDKKLSGDERFGYCIESLKNMSKIGHWRDAVDFRTDNINFMQNHSSKVSAQRNADLYIALALTDCASKKYDQAFRLLTGMGYKPKGKSDTKLIEILITGVYIWACKGEQEGLEDAVQNAYSGLKIISFPHKWNKEYYEQCIEDAINKII